MDTLYHLAKWVYETLSVPSNPLIWRPPGCCQIKGTTLKIGPLSPMGLKVFGMVWAMDTL